jgi:hypothetical protein
MGHEREAAMHETEHRSVDQPVVTADWSGASADAT